MLFFLIKRAIEMCKIVHERYEDMGKIEVIEIYERKIEISLRENL